MCSKIFFNASTFFPRTHSEQEGAQWPPIHPIYAQEHAYQNGDEPPGSVRSEIADTTYNLSPISPTWPFTKLNVTSPAQEESY